MLGPRRLDPIPFLRTLKQCFFTRHFLGSRIEAFRHQDLLSSRKSSGDPWGKREPPPKYPVARPSVPSVTYTLLQDNMPLARYRFLSILQITLAS